MHGSPVNPGMPKLILLAFLASTGVTFLVLGCALQQYNVWWPMFVIVFYFLSPFPTLVARRFSDGEERSSALFEVCCFITTCIVLSSYGLPIILARKSIIEWGACGFVMAGNAVIFVAIFLLFYFFTREDDSFEYSTW